MKIFTKDPTTNLKSRLCFLGAILTISLMISADALSQSLPVQTALILDANTVTGPAVLNSIGDGLAPQEFAYIQNYPNAFKLTKTIGYGIKEKSSVKIILFNAIGEEVAVVLNEEKESGYHQVEFNAATLPSGVYFYQLKVYPENGGVSDFVGTRKMMLLK
jgi:hypothetical protein